MNNMSPTKKSTCTKENIDIIIFSGQSNMQGQSEYFSDCLPIENVFEYKYLDDEIIPLGNPVGENITKEGEKEAKVKSKLFLNSQNNLNR